MEKLSLEYTHYEIILYQAITKNLAMHDGSRVYFRSTAASSNKKVKTPKVNNSNGFTLFEFMMTILNSLRCV